MIINKNNSNEKKNVLFIIAHPDDECMFFTPTIKYYQYKLEYNLSIVCLSNGNANGLGKIREKELIDSCVDLGIPKENVYIDDSNNFQDGMKIQWDLQLIENSIQSFVNKTSADIIISFDERGVSSHPNHISIANALQSLIFKKNKQNKDNKEDGRRKSVNCYNDNTDKEIKAYKLETVNIIRKYIGINDIILSRLLSYDLDSTQIICDTQMFPPSSYSPMTKHKSQFVWFRYLFVFFSRYSFINTLIEIK